MDARGNVFVTGASYGSEGSDYATIAYSRAGLPLWTNRYNGLGRSEDRPASVAVDGSGNVFVTGSSVGSGDNYSDYATIAYSGAGAALWTNRYGGREKTLSIANALAVDGNGNVFVTGTSTGRGGKSYYTIAYSSGGAPLWTHRHDEPSSAVSVDGRGNVFVMGNSATIAYSGAGVPLWTNRYNGPEDFSIQASALTVDGSGKVFVTGSSVDSDGSSDYVTIAYSDAGVPLWTNFYKGQGDSDDLATSVAVDGSGNVIVTGSSSGSGFIPDYVTIAYSGAGVALWTNRYDGPQSLSDKPNAVAVNGSGSVFVTGNSATIAYSGAGLPLWTNYYHRDATALAVDARGNVFVTGSSVDNQGYFVSTSIAYSAAGVPFWTNRYEGTVSDRYDGTATIVAVAVDRTGTVFVTGIRR